MGVERTARVFEEVTEGTAVGSGKNSTRFGGGNWSRRQVLLGRNGMGRLEYQSKKEADEEVKAGG